MTIALAGIAIAFLILAWAVYRQRRRVRHQAACKQCGKVHSAYGMSSRKPPPLQ